MLLVCCIAQQHTHHRHATTQRSTIKRDVATRYRACVNGISSRIIMAALSGILFARHGAASAKHRARRRHQHQAAAATVRSTSVFIGGGVHRCARYSAARLIKLALSIGGAFIWTARRASAALSATTRHAASSTARTSVRRLLIALRGCVTWRAHRGRFVTSTSCALATRHCGVAAKHRRLIFKTRSASGINQTRETSCGWRVASVANALDGSISIIERVSPACLTSRGASTLSSCRIAASDNASKRYAVLFGSTYSVGYLRLGVKQRRVTHCCGGAAITSAALARRTRQTTSSSFTRTHRE